MNTEITETNKGWVLYDGECPLCRRWVGWVYRPLRRRGFKFATLQAPWVREKFKLKDNEPLREMRVITPDGRNFGGADALAELARAVWWAWPFYLSSLIPGTRAILRRGYEWIAQRRHCLGGACQLPGHTPEHSVTSAFYKMP